MFYKNYQNIFSGILQQDRIVYFDSCIYMYTAHRHKHTFAITACESIKYKTYIISKKDRLKRNEMKHV